MHHHPNPSVTRRRRIAALLSGVVIAASIGSAFVEPSGAEEATRTLRITQLDPEGNVVPGGCYQLDTAPETGEPEGWDNSCDTFDDAGKDGVIVFTDVPAGHYTATEHDAPDGFRVNATPIAVDLTAGDLDRTNVHQPAPLLTVRFEDTAGALVPGACALVTDPGVGEADYGHMCDGPEVPPYPGDGTPDGKVSMIDIPDAELALGVFNVPAGYTGPEGPVPFTMPDADHTVIVTLTGGTENPRGCTVTGTSGDDTLFGTGRADVICGLGGDDTVFAGRGNDKVYGDAGNDRVYGENGDDTVDAGEGNDTIHGGGHHDTALCGAGTDSWRAVEARSSCEIRF